MVMKKNSFEGGTNTVAVSPANSGGASGDAFYSIIPGAGASITYTNVRAAHGTLSSAHVVTASTVSAYQFAPTDSGGRGVFRFYVYFTSLPTSRTFLASIRTTGDAFMGGVFIHSTGTMRVSVKPPLGDLDGSASGTVPTNEWLRVELAVTKGTTTTDGRIAFNIYQADSTTPLHSYDSGATVNTGTTDCTKVYFGSFDSGTAWNGTFWMDDLAMDLNLASGWIGPEVNQPPSVTVGANQNVTASATVNLTSTSTDTDGTIASRLWTFDYPTTGAPALTNATSANASFTAGAAGSLYILRHTATDNGGLTDYATMEVRVPTAGTIRPLPGNATGAGSWTNVGGAATDGAALADESDATYLQSAAVTSTEQARRMRLAPSTTRTTGQIVVRVSQDMAGTMTSKARLFEGSTQRQEWTLTTTTSIADQTLTITSPGAISDWGNLYLELAATT